jgi:hypothetical protein
MTFCSKNCYFGRINFRSNDPFLKKTLSVKRLFNHMEWLLLEKSFRSNDITVKSTFGQMIPFSKRKLSDKKLFGQMTILSNDPLSNFFFGYITFFVESRFGQPIFCFIFWTNNLSVKRRSVKHWFGQKKNFGQTAFGQMTFGKPNQWFSIKWTKTALIKRRKKRKIAILFSFVQQISLSVDFDGSLKFWVLRIPYRFQLRIRKWK